VENTVGNSWTCPFCSKPTTINQQDISEGHLPLHYETKHGDVGFGFYSIRCPNDECQEVYLAVEFENRKPDLYNGGYAFESLETWVLRPEALTKPQPDYIPKPIRNDYLEACLIQERSPKASATLSRRCLQGMIRDFWNIKKSRLIDEINALQEHVEPEVWEAINAVRKVGNVGAHMEKDINLIIDVDPREARLLIELIEQLFEEWYVRREQRKDRIAKVTALANVKAMQKESGKTE
jgi:hypothetical protein